MPLSNALRLIIVLQDLTITNKLLKADWDERSSVLLTMVRDIAQIRSGVYHSPSYCCTHLTYFTDTAAASLPRSACRELALSIVHKLPPSLINHDTLAKVCLFSRYLVISLTTPFLRCHISLQTHPSMSRRWLISYFGSLRESGQNI